MLSLNIPQIIFAVGLIVTVLGCMRMFKAVKEGIFTLVLGLGIVGLTLLSEAVSGRSPLELFHGFTGDELHSEQLNSQEIEKQRLRDIQAALNAESKTLNRNDAKAAAEFDASVRALELRYEQYKARYGDGK
jgi:hypothetical protein